MCASADVHINGDSKDFAVSAGSVASQQVCSLNDRASVTIPVNFTGRDLRTVDWAANITITPTTVECTPSVPEAPATTLQTISYTCDFPVGVTPVTFTLTEDGESWCCVEVAA